MAVLDWGASGATANGTMAVNHGGDSVLVTISSVRVSDGAQVGSVGNASYNGTTHSVLNPQGSVTEPHAYTFTFGDPVENIEFDLWDVDQRVNRWDDVVTIIALDANGNVLPVTVTTFYPTGGAVVHDISTNASGYTMIDATGEYSGGVEGPEAPDSLRINIDGPISSLQLIHEDGTNHTATGSIRIGDMSFDMTDPDGTVSGTSGDDTIDLAYIDATDGEMVDNNDGTLGTTGNQDVIEAGTGNDSVLGGAAEDTIYGGDGDDVITAGQGSDIVYGGAGADAINSGDSANPLPDATDPTPNDDLDTVYGGSGNDTITTGDDADSIDGGIGEDSIDGGIDNDSIVGGEGNDTISGGDGDDVIIGDNDDLPAGFSDYLVEGYIADENYTLTNDHFGSSGATAITVDGGPMEIRFVDNDANLEGDDAVSEIPDDADGLVEINGVLYNYGADYQVEMLGSDGITYTMIVVDVDLDGDGAFNAAGNVEDGHVLIPIGAVPPAGVTLTSTNVWSTTTATPYSTLNGASTPNYDDSIDGGAGNDNILGGEGSDVIDGGIGDDTITAGDSLNPLPDATDPDPTDDLDTVYGGDGADRITTGDDNDVIYGGSGNDTVDAGIDDDSVYGGIGDDSITAGDGNDLVDGGSGDDVIDTSGPDGIATDYGLDVPTIYEGLYPDVQPDADPNNDLDTVYGGAGNDSISTGDDRDTIDGGIGNDTIDSGIDDDSVAGGDGDDSINAGVGSDLVYGGDGDDVIDAGFDFIPDVDVAGDPYPFDDPNPDDGKDTIFGGADNDTISAGIDNDTVEGGTGDDVIHGDAGSDTIEGGDGADTLYGGADDDDIITSAGDVAYGGGGDDVFTVAPTAAGSGPITIEGGETDEGGADTTNGGAGDTLDLSTLYAAGQIQAGSLNFAPGDPEAGSVTLTDGTVVNFTEIENFICFTRGTMIRTDMGEKPIEELMLGDKVLTKDHGYQALRWIGSRRLPAKGKIAPIMIKAGAMGNTSDLMVSPQHRILVEGWKTEMLFGEAQVLAAAKHLVNGDTIFQAEGGEVEYVHILFDDHEIVYANGAASESFPPGKEGFDALTEDAREEVLTLFPELRENLNCRGSSARTSLKANEAAILASNPEFLW